MADVTSISDSAHSGVAAATISSATYDDLHRLTRVNRPSGGPTNFTYNSIGNMTANGESGPGTNYGYGVRMPHAVKAANGNNYAYDANGSMIVRGNNQRLYYDLENRLVTVLGTNQITSFGYDGNGARLWKQTTGRSSLQVWIGDNYEEKQGQILFHVLAAGQVVCTFDSTGNNVFEYYHPDNLHSSSVMSDKNGGLAQHYEYGAYGTSRYTQSNTAFPVTKRYTGQALDEDTGLYFYGSRYYDPQLARFIQTDTLLPDIFDPQSLNRYSYVRNNPLKYIDPTGHSWLPFWEELKGRMALNAMVKAHTEYGTYKEYMDSLGLGPTTTAGDLGSIAAVAHTSAAAADTYTTFLPDLATAGLATPIPAITKVGRAGEMEVVERSSTTLEKIVGGNKASMSVEVAATKGLQTFKTFDALKSSLGPAGKDMAWHHIVEQSQIGRFGADAIHNTENVVAVSSQINQKINGIYSSINKGITGSETLTVRQWLSTKSYQEARQFGLQTLKKVESETTP